MDNGQGEVFNHGLEEEEVNHGPHYPLSADPVLVGINELSKYTIRREESELRTCKPHSSAEGQGRKELIVILVPEHK